MDKEDDPPALSSVFRRVHIIFELTRASAVCAEWTDADLEQIRRELDVDERATLIEIRDELDRVFRGLLP
jgi:hypothetical protein